MAIAFAYTKSTNTAVVTGGTSGTPATFADFVTADRAGSVTLLAAHAPASNLTLTYQITPVEKLGLLISFVVAAKTAEADYIFITGTDSWGVAQTESINVTVGNGTYVSVLHWRTITNIDCSDNAAGGGTVWADGTVAVTQPQWGVIWNYGNNKYHVDSILSIGDGATATVFANVAVDWSIGSPTNRLAFYVKANAVFKQGAKGTGTLAYYNGGSIRSYGDMAATTVGELDLYGVLWYYSIPNGLNWGSAGVIDFENCQIVNPALTGAVYFTSTSSGTMTDCKFYGSTGMALYTANITINVLYISEGYRSIFTTSFLTGIALITNLEWGTPTAFDIQLTKNFTGSNYVYIINANKVSPIITWTGSGTGTEAMRLSFTCDLNICDKDGVSIVDAVVDCEDQYGTPVWSPGTVTTNASGDIPQQITKYKKYYWDGAEQNTVYSPHKFTISKAGYQTLVLDNITVDHPIVWHLELQNPSGGGALNKRIGVGVF